MIISTWVGGALIDKMGRKVILIIGEMMIISTLLSMAILLYNDI
jgi:hypothetical protein